MIHILAEIAAGIAVALVLRTFVAAFSVVKGSSMAPTLKNGDVLLVLMRRGRWRRVQRGDVVICRYPGRGRKYFVKRVVGMPGDTVCRTAGVTLLEGESLDARANRFRGDYEYTLGADEYFCVGDNRASSHDSRDWQRSGKNQVGPIAESMICGVAKYVIWPPGVRCRIDRDFVFEGVQPVIIPEIVGEEVNSDGNDDEKEA